MTITSTRYVTNTARDALKLTYTRRLEAAHTLQKIKTCEEKIKQMREKENERPYIEIDSNRVLCIMNYPTDLREADQYWIIDPLKKIVYSRNASS